jgi:predicted dehydrogenase
MGERGFSLALVGFGYWGPVLLRNFAANPRFCIRYVVDRHAEKAAAVQKLVPNCKFVGQIADALKDPALDVVVIATQAETHRALTEEVLRSGKHVFVEKPFTLSHREAETLCKLAANLKRTIWVDHTFLFNPAYAVLKKHVAEGKIGAIRRLHSNRTAFGLFQRDANVFWHLLYHDVYILLDLIPQMPERVLAAGSANIYPNVIDAGIVSLHYENGTHATFLSDMTQPHKKRDITVSGPRGSLVWDEAKISKLSFHSHSATPVFGGQGLNYVFPGTQEELPVPSGEALALEIEAFGSYLAEAGSSCLCDGTRACQAMRLLEAINSALSNDS